MKKKIAASLIAQHIAHFAFDDLCKEESSGRFQKIFKEVLNIQISLDKEQKLTLNIWLLAHSINPSINLFSEKISLILRGSALIEYGDLANIPHAILIKKYTAYTEYFYENFPNHTFADAYWLLNELGYKSDLYNQNALLLTLLCSFPFDPPKDYTGILKEYYVDKFKIIGE